MLDAELFGFQDGCCVMSLLISLLRKGRCFARADSNTQTTTALLRQHLVRSDKFKQRWTQAEQWTQCFWLCMPNDFIHRKCGDLMGIIHNWKSHLDSLEVGHIGMRQTSPIGEKLWIDDVDGLLTSTFQIQHCLK